VEAEEMNMIGQLVRLGVIGAAMLGVTGAFAYTGGWLSPDRLTPDRMMTAFQEASGSHPGFRRNHAKGVCVTGWFESNGTAESLSAAAVFKPGRVPVVGRFALAGGVPFQADAPATVRSMALRFLPANGAEWRTGMNNIPVFPVNSAQGFYEQLLAAAPDPKTGKPDPARMSAFMAAHPEAVRAIEIIRGSPASSGFANATYNSLNAFRLIDAKGASVPVRWATIPVQSSAPETGVATAASDRNDLFDALIADIKQRPLQWRLVFTLGQPGDPTADATLPWPADRPHIDAVDGHHRPCGERGWRTMHRHQLRSAGPAARDRTLRRSPAERPLRGLCALVHAARGGDE
jgi:catalase